MKKVVYIDRRSKAVKVEEVYGKWVIDLLYGRRWLGIFRPVIAKIPLFSKMYGALQKTFFSKRKIIPFIQKFQIDMTEFETKNFNSFNDFFIRKLKSECREISNSDAVLPADGRYRIFENSTQFVIKGKVFDAETLIGRKGCRGPIVIGRLAPVDYHRFHFPVDGVVKETVLMNGPLYSVNPVAVFHNLAVLTENKRMVTEIDTEAFGKVFMVEVGATYVGSIVQTYQSGSIKRGEEKGYFEFGGSCVILLFEEDRITFDTDLFFGLEVYARMGESLGQIKQRK
ncbi:MAG: phosphatidylserine decarboxylase [Simkaniaceae bacterium]|nr:phosphatidylserine decarboxylase [Simkaniaceae bacterium]